VKPQEKRFKQFLVNREVPLDDTQEWRRPILLGFGSVAAVPNFAIFRIDNPPAAEAKYSEILIGGVGCGFYTSLCLPQLRVRSAICAKRI
jgi:hypothetical protein